MYWERRIVVMLSEVHDLYYLLVFVGVVAALIVNWADGPAVA